MHSLGSWSVEFRGQKFVLHVAHIIRYQVHVWHAAHHTWEVDVHRASPPNVIVWETVVYADDYQDALLQVMEWLRDAS